MGEGGKSIRAVAAARAGAEHLSRYWERDEAGLDGTADVEAAVVAFREALAASGGQPAHAYNLAVALQSRYDAVGSARDDDRDLREAVTLLDGAVADAG